jgi:CUB/sushi domain-containing protein
MAMRITDENGKTNAVYYKCENGYEIEGNDVLICEAPHWLGGLPECKQSLCPAPPFVANASTIILDKKEVLYICDIGFTMVGIDHMTCIQNATWITEEHPYCEPVDCGKPPHVDEYSMVVSDNRTTYESSITYNCTLGYKMMGESNSTCLMNGSWSGTGPTCVPVSCSNLASPENGEVKGELFTYGATIQFSCNKGYRLVGASAAECMENGHWSNKEPKCESKLLSNLSFLKLKLEFRLTRCVI